MNDTKRTPPYTVTITREEWDEYMRLLTGDARLREVASGALGYLEALPPSHRPDEAWFVPLRAALRREE